MSHDQPVMLVYPNNLSDEQAHALCEFLHELINSVERHYGAQLRRYHQKMHVELDEEPF